MSAPLQSYLHGLFGEAAFSDCEVHFYCCAGGAAAASEGLPLRDGVALTSDSGTPQDRPRKHPRQEDGAETSRGEAVASTDAALQAGTAHASAEVAAASPGPHVEAGSPLKAHLVVLCGGSERFRVQAERWIQNQPPGSKPVLRVPLESDDDLPSAMSALRFIYTNKLTDADGIKQLFRVRRQAAYLQVEGCKEACDVAVTERITVSSTPPQGSTGAVAGVFEVFTARELLPDPTEEPGAFSSIMHACRQQIVAHSGSGKIEGPVAEGTPSLGDVLGWAFGDAPCVLSDPKTRRQMEQLSPAAMEALLGSSTFATDDESSVLLMLAVWLQANTATSEDTRKRLCRLLRLSHVSSDYLQIILPTLPWFPISTAEHRFLCLYAAANVNRRAYMALQVAGSYDCSSPWYSAPARPSSTTSPRRYEWYIDQDQLKEKQLAPDTQVVDLQGSFTNGKTSVTSLGFEWCPQMHFLKGSDKVGVYLHAHLPSALLSSMPVSEQRKIPVPPGAARVAVKGRLLNGSIGEIWDTTYNEDYVPISESWGTKEALTLSQAGGGPGSGEADPLAAWSAYLQDGKISGVLEWEAESEAEPEVEAEE